MPIKALEKYAGYRATLQDIIEVCSVERPVLGTHGQVYVWRGYFAAVEGMHKIGTTCAWQNRAKGLQIADPEPTVVVESNRAYLLEKVLHVVFNHKNIAKCGHSRPGHKNFYGREWFDLDEDDLAWFRSLRFIDGMRVVALLPDSVRDLARNT